MNDNNTVTNKIRYNTLVLILGFAGFISAADNWIVSPILPVIASGFATSISKAGVVLTAYMIPYGIMQPVYGFFSDRWSKAKILRCIVCGLALGTIGCTISYSLWTLSIWRAVTGFFAAGIIAVSLALIGDTVPTLERQVYVGKFMGIVFLGQGLSAGLGGIFAKYISWRIAFAFFSGIAICAVFFLHKLPKDLPIPMSNMSNRFFIDVKRVIFTKKGKVIFPLAFIAGFLLLGLYSYLGSFLHQVIKLDYLEVGIVIMFYGFACLIAGSQVGKLGQKFGQQRVIIMGGSFALITALLLIFFPFWQTGWIATISLGFGYIFIQSTLATIAFDVAVGTKGLSSGLIGLGLFGGGGLGTAFGGWLLSQGGYQILWIVFSIGVLVLILSISKIHFD